MDSKSWPNTLLQILEIVWNNLANTIVYYHQIEIHPFTSQLIVTYWFWTFDAKSLKGYLQRFTSCGYTFCESCHLQRSLAAKILGTIYYLWQGGGWVIGGGLQFFPKKLGVGMLNMRSGGLQIFVQKIGGLLSFGYHKKRKTIVIIMILTKEVENFLGPPICVQHSEVLCLLLGKLSHWT